MRQQRKHRLYITLVIALGTALIVALVLYALRQNINLYWTPSQLREQLQKHNTAVYKHSFRLGGLVVPGSVHFAKQGLGVHFKVTDIHDNTTIFYQGVLPTLFKEGRGVITQGLLRHDGVMLAEEVLAKHDENYAPPGMIK